MKLKLDENTLKLIDTEYDIMANNADADVIEKSKRELGQMEAILGHDDTFIKHDRSFGDLAVLGENTLHYLGNKLLTDSQRCEAV